MARAVGGSVSQRARSVARAPGSGARATNRLATSVASPARSKVLVPLAGARSTKRCGTFSAAVARQASRLGMSRLDELLTADEVAELLHIPSSTVSDYARRGVLPS